MRKTTGARAAGAMGPTPRAIRLRPGGAQFHTPGVEWHTLHTGAETRRQARGSGGCLRETLAGDSAVFDRAALASHLDLTIVVDCMPVHLAGGLGRLSPEVRVRRQSLVSRHASLPAATDRRLERAVGSRGSGRASTFDSWFLRADRYA